MCKFIVTFNFNQSFYSGDFVKDKFWLNDRNLINSTESHGIQYLYLTKVDTL